LDTQVKGKFALANSKSASIKTSTWATVDFGLMPSVGSTIF
jgi:hypothetical protein